MRTTHTRRLGVIRLEPQSGERLRALRACHGQLGGAHFGFEIFLEALVEHLHIPDRLAAFLCGNQRSARDYYYYFLKKKMN